MHIASFVGIAPVNNPVISIAVIIDNPQKGPSYYGTAVSAPVFAEVAQKALEYLGVPHDTPLVEQPDLAKQHTNGDERMTRLQTTLGISTRCLPKSTIYPRMILFA